LPDRKLLRRLGEATRPGCRLEGDQVTHGGLVKAL
jgi:hypothetical protein